MASLLNLFNEEEKNNKLLQEDIDTVMRYSPSYIDIMIEEVMHIIAMTRMRESYKRMSC